MIHWLPIKVLTGVFRVNPAKHRFVTGLIYYGMFSLGIFVIAMFAMLGDWLVDGEWGFAAALVGMFIGFGVVFQLFRQVRRKRRDSLFRLSFPGYEGKPVPAGNLLSLSLPEGGQSFVTGALSKQMHRHLPDWLASFEAGS